MMTLPWQEELSVSIEMATQLIERQFPELRDLPISILGKGFDNAAFLVGPWVFRFPQRQLAVPFIKAEIDFLPYLAPQLPFAVPAPRWIGQPSELYPWPFAGYAFLEGKTACSANLTPEDREKLAEPIGYFLSILHKIKIPLVFPEDTLQKAHLPSRVERMALWAAELKNIDTKKILAEVKELAETPLWGEQARLVHGDFYARHLLVNSKQKITSVIDWGDVHKGDPALDLAIGWTFIPPEGRENFLKAYGKMDPATWRRAKFHAFRYGLVCSWYGDRENDSGMIQIGSWALNNLTKN